MDREKVKQKLLEEFMKKNVEPPQWIDFMVDIIYNDFRCTWSERWLKECIENAVFAYMHEQIEREVAKLDKQRKKQG